MKHGASLKRSFSRSKAKCKSTDASNIVTLSSLAKDINDTKRELRKISVMIEIQTEIMEGILKIINNKEDNPTPTTIIKQEDNPTPTTIIKQEDNLPTIIINNQ